MSGDKSIKTKSWKTVLPENGLRQRKRHFRFSFSACMLFLLTVDCSLLWVMRPKQMTPLGNSEHNMLLQPALTILLRGVCVFHKCVFADKCTHKCATLQKEKSHSSEVISQDKNHSIRTQLSTNKQNQMNINQNKAKASDRTARINLHYLLIIHNFYTLIISHVCTKMLEWQSVCTIQCSAVCIFFFTINLFSKRIPETLVFSCCVPDIPFKPS